MSRTFTSMFKKFFGIFTEMDKIWVINVNVFGSRVLFLTKGVDGKYSDFKIPYPGVVIVEIKTTKQSTKCNGN